MALFPAYSSNKDDLSDVDLPRIAAADEPSAECAEAQLLASDGEGARSRSRSPARRRGSPEPSADFYLDRRLDRGNLRVSTLYYPGRPEYACAAARSTRASEARARRYYAQRAPDAPVAPALLERVDAFRRLLAAAPLDRALWESFIDFQEAVGGAEGALAAAEEARARLPRSGRLRARLLTALRRALPPHAALDRLRDMLPAEPSVWARVELWEALLGALAAAPGGDPAALDAAAAAALADTRAHPAAYPRLLHARAALLRAAGLSERLVLLVELVLAMNFAPDAARFPPAPPADTERRLQRREHAALAAGLPRAAAWVRVERLRAAAHWRAPPAAAAPDPDPQRAPLPHDVAELLLPAAPAALPRLAARLLLLAGVPLLPGGGAAARWAGAAHDASALLPLLAAAGELPATHGARVAGEEARRALLLLLDPPHCFDDDAGYLRWVEALWDALAERLSGAARVALCCWRVRWLGALAALAGAAEAARLRARARSLLRDAEHPLPFAEFARLERRVAGAGRATSAAAAALRGALGRADEPAPERLYAARVVAEVSASGAALSAAGACALTSAVLQRAPPAQLPAPDAAALHAALQECERQCAAVEAQLDEGERDDEDEEEDVAALLLPGAGEWAAARALLAPPPRRAQLLRRLLAAAPRARCAAAARYWEEGGAALAAAAAREGRAGAVARQLLPLFPHCAALALRSAGAPLWAWGAGGAAERLRALLPRGDTAALGALLPPLARALRSDFAPPEAERLVRLARRAAGADSGALLWALRLEAEARAPRPRLQHALYAALDAVPYAKWLYVRGAAWCGGEAAALSDAMLERQLRLHALPDELAPLPDELTALPDELAPLPDELTALPDELTALPDELTALPDELTALPDELTALPDADEPHE